MFDEEKFVLLVSEYKELYDHNDKNYCNRESRDNCWREIANLVGISEELCKNVWKKLRDQYRKAMQLRANEQHIKRRPWKLEHQMSFLLPFLKERQGHKSGGDDDDHNDDSLETHHLWSPAPATNNLNGLKRKFAMAQQEDSSVLSKYLESNIQEELHPLTKFFISMAETTLTLPLNLQIEIKKKVFEAVITAELSALNPADTNSEISNSNNY